MAKKKPSKKRIERFGSTDGEFIKIEKKRPAADTDKKK